MSGEDPIITEDTHSKRYAYAARVSTNISAAKGGAALIVMAGHIGTGIPNYWVVVTVGLLVFSISSGYFTWLRYHDNFQWQRFWRRKVARLIPRLLVIELFLFVLFLAQGREDLWSWDTALYIFPGLPGFLAWFHIPNQSPYGLGMWYLSLLLIFYTVYPLLERLYRRIGSFTATAGGILCLFALHNTVLYGHALWLTAAGFLVGIFLSSRQMRLPAVTAGGMAAATAIGMVVSHAIFKFDAANFFFILTIAAGGILFLFEIELPEIVTHVGGWLSGVLLEIYLLHPYLQVNPTGIYRLDQGISVAIVLLVAWLLAWFAKRVGRFVRWLQ
jgi:surface polysaccharide O-acyltransferase-like enzyme